MKRTNGASLALQGVAHSFTAGRPVFENISETMTSGQVWAVTGPSGSGKSTLLSLLAGWQPPCAGIITRTGINTTAWVFQNPHGQAHRTALDHVAYPMIARGVARPAASHRAARILDELGLRTIAERTFAQLSGGEAQRLMLCRAIASEPDLLLVDEPTAQLDRTNAETVNTVLHALAGIGAIVVIATHDRDTAAACGYHLALDKSAAPKGGWS